MLPTGQSGNKLLIFAANWNWPHFNGQGVEKMTGAQRRSGRMRMDEAEALAITALGFIAAEETRLVQFLSVSGYAPADIRAEAGTPAFLAGVLDFLLGDESLLLVFSSHGDVDPADVAAASRCLGGAFSGE
jgi:hypothetical protein